MKLNAFKLIAGFLFLFSQDSHATKNTTGFWFGTSSKKQITDNYQLAMEAQIRRNNDTGNVDQLVYGVGANQKITDSHKLGYFYGFIHSETRKEHRFTLQHTAHLLKLDDWKIGHRARFEWRDNEDRTDDTGRFRYRLSSSTPILDERWTFSISNEVFVNLSNESWNGNRGFDRNRAFIGLKRSFKTISLQAGYLNQYKPRTGQDTSEHNLVISIGI